MTLRKKYEIKRRALLFGGDFETPGRYRKLTDEEIAAEWFTPRKQIVRSRSLTNLESRQDDTNQTRYIHPLEDQNAGHRSKSISATCENSVSLRPSRPSPAFNNPQRRFTTEINVTIEPRIKDVYNDSGGKETKNQPAPLNDDIIVNKEVDISELPSITSTSNDAKAKHDISETSTKNVNIAHEDSCKKHISGHSLFEPGSDVSLEDGKSRVTGKVGHCLTCKCQTEFLTLADASCQTKTRKHSSKKTETDQHDTSTKVAHDDVEKSSYSTGSVKSHSFSSTSSSNTTDDTKSWKEIFVINQTNASHADQFMDLKGQQVSCSKIPLDDVITNSRAGNSTVPAQIVENDVSVEDRFDYVKIPTPVWAKSSKESTTFICFGELRNDDVPELTSTPRQASQLKSGMAACVEDKPVNKYTEMNGETMQKSASVGTTTAGSGVTSLPSRETTCTDLDSDASADKREKSGESSSGPDFKRKESTTSSSESSSHNTDSIDGEKKDTSVSGHSDIPNTTESLDLPDASKTTGDTTGLYGSNSPAVNASTETTVPSGLKNHNTEGFEYEQNPSNVLNSSNETQELIIYIGPEGEQTVSGGQLMPVTYKPFGESPTYVAVEVKCCEVQSKIEIVETSPADKIPEENTDTDQSVRSERKITDEEFATKVSSEKKVRLISKTSTNETLDDTNTSNNVIVKSDELHSSNIEQPYITITVTAPPSENMDTDSWSEAVIHPCPADSRLADVPLKKAKVYVPSTDSDSSSDSESSSSAGDNKVKQKRSEESKHLKEKEKVEFDSNKEVDTISSDQNENCGALSSDSLSAGVTELNKPSHSADHSYPDTNVISDSNVDVNKPNSFEELKKSDAELRIDVSKTENKINALSTEAGPSEVLSNGLPLADYTKLSEITLFIRQNDNESKEWKDCVPDSSTDVRPEQIEIPLPGAVPDEVLLVSQNQFPPSFGQNELSFGDKNQLPLEGKIEVPLQAQADVSFQNERSSANDEKELSSAGQTEGDKICNISSEQSGERNESGPADEPKDKTLDTSSSSDDKNNKVKKTRHTSIEGDTELRNTPKSRQKKNRVSSMLDRIKHKIFSDTERPERPVSVGQEEKASPVAHSPAKPKRKFRRGSLGKGKRKSFDLGNISANRDMVEIDPNSEMDKLEGKQVTSACEPSIPDVQKMSVGKSPEAASRDQPNAVSVTSKKDIKGCDSTPDKGKGVIYITNTAERSMFSRDKKKDKSSRSKSRSRSAERKTEEETGSKKAHAKTPVLNSSSKKDKSDTEPLEVTINDNDTKPKYSERMSSSHSLSRSSSSSSSESSRKKEKEQRTDKVKTDSEHPTCFSQTSSAPADTTPSVTILSPSKLAASPSDSEPETKQGSLYTECIPLEAVPAPESLGPKQQNYFVVVAIDFGTTYSGYALSFTRDPDGVHMMRNWEGGDPGVVNQKIPTSILLTPEGEFDSFGFTARDRYHNLDHNEAKNWLYFEKFKMILHNSSCSDDWKILRNDLYGKQMQLTKDTHLYASNGQPFPALKIFSYALRFFKDHALEQLSDQCCINMLNCDVRWVITVPAIWKAPAKQFMRQAAYDAGMVSPGLPDQMLIALEPEAASIYCRKLKVYELVPESPVQRPLQSPRRSVLEPLNTTSVCSDFTEEMPKLRSPFDLASNQMLETKMKGTRYLVVDCGGGTVDITVHELDGVGKLKELYKATGGPYGSIGIDIEFEKLLYAIFGEEFIHHYKTKYPVGWINLMINFESRKRSASPFKSNPLNISVPFSFIDYHKKQKIGHIESTVKKYGDGDICWSSEGMLRLSPVAMKRLFLPTLEKIKQTIGDVLNNKQARDLSYMFLVGGFAESPILQQEIRKEFSHIVKILIPNGVSLAILKGAVLFGLDPTIVNVRRSRLTYGVGVLNRFDPEKHPKSKLVTRDGTDWCTDIFEKYVTVDEPITLGDTVVRSYTPAKMSQQVSIINIYSSESANCQFITDPGVRKCGTLCLDLSDLQVEVLPVRREIQTKMMFGDTEIRVSALDVTTGRCVKASIDFLNK